MRNHSRPQPRAAAIVLAGGNGTRTGEVMNKVYLHLAGRTVVSWSIRALAQVALIDRCVLVIRERDRDIAQQTIDRELWDIDIEVVVGGNNRRRSELSALRRLAPAIVDGSIDTVVVHDGARPLVSPTLVRELLAAAAEFGAAIPGIRADDIAQVMHDGTVGKLPEHTLFRAQTPQVFRASALLNAYEKAESENFPATDTESCVHHYTGMRAHVVPGDERNIKITYPDDLLKVDLILRDADFTIV